MNSFSELPPDLTGYKFGYFTVENEAQHKIRANGKKVRRWQCRCSCGNIRLLNRQEIRTQKRKSCGCKHDEYAKIINTEHGDSHTRLHNIWSGIRERCYCKTDYHYKWYGGRGIKMDEQWRNNYLAFKEWSLCSGYSPEFSIDRINNDGDYTPENCRWVTQKEQSNNTRRNRRITAFGRTQTLSQWADETGIKYDTIKRRLYHGWKPEDALTPNETRKEKTE